MNHEKFLNLAIEQANLSTDLNNKAGAVLVKPDGIVAKGCNRTRQLNNPIAIAEMDCIRQAGRRSDQSELTLYSTRYPDMLVAGTIMQFSIGAMVIGLPQRASQAIDFLEARGVPMTFVEIEACKILENNNADNA